ncbi:hypothetical protein [Alteromonas sp. ASW11-130]|uniref:hypothetical protein n=1 Tax=Alteromonas sp. ASW11-130 TaxID=3015775 RepID=UPI002242909D|nr:hypothetical protein [Alteromonas sp. ASW11-130]MCW8093083.1 hypothetical protein [Alteromonas sp. ASW11-130]
MIELNHNYVIAVAEQLSFVSAFLGGISATILVTIVVFTSPNKSVSGMVASSALAACSLLIAVVASWRLIILLHPTLPISVEPSLIKVLWNAMLMGYGLGFLSLLVSIGLSGWLRSRKSGLITTCIALVAVLFFVVATPFGV